MTGFDGHPGERLRRRIQSSNSYNTRHDFKESSTVMSHFAKASGFAAIATVLLLFAACSDGDEPSASGDVQPTSDQPASTATVAPEVEPISFELLDVWGDDPSEPQFMGPNHMAIGPDGNLYVTEFRGGRLFKLAPDGTVLGEWAGDGELAGELGAPTGVYVDSDGFIYVDESGNSRVQKFSPDGESVASWGERGQDAGQFLSAMGMVAEDGKVFAVDYGNSRVQVFTSDGEYLFSFGEPGRADGQLQNPIGLDSDVDGNLYVVDAGNRRVQKFSSDGAHIATFNTGALVGEVAPQVISLDPRGVFYLSHPGSALVLAFDLEGRRLAALPTAGLRGTHDTAISPDGERLYVADTGNNLVKVYQVTRN